MLVVDFLRCLRRLLIFHIILVANAVLMCKATFVSLLLTVLRNEKCNFSNFKISCLKQSV
eukprot:UN13755